MLQQHLYRQIPAPTPETMVFIEVYFYESKTTVVGKWRTMVIADESDSLLAVVEKAVAKFIRHQGKEPNTDAINAAIKRIQAITTSIGDPLACDLHEFLSEPKATLANLNSKTTPILEGGININLPDEEVINVDDDPATSSAPPPKKQKIDAFAAMMGSTTFGVSYLQYEEDMDQTLQIDEQIKHVLYVQLEQMGLGYRDQKQHSKLKANTEKIKNTLCFVQKYWKVLLRADFPHLPQGDFAHSKFISSLQDTRRTSTK